MTSGSATTTSPMPPVGRRTWPAISRRSAGASSKAHRSCSAALVDLAVAAFPVRRPQLELLQLAGRRTSEHLAELDRGRRLVARDLGLAVRDEVGLGERRPLGLHHQRLDGLAPLLVRYADDGDLRDVGMAEDDVLDLDRRNVLAAGDDHVLLAVADRQVALVVDGAAVAGVEPAALQRLRRLLRLLPVALEDDVGTGEHLALGVDLERHAEGRVAGTDELGGLLQRRQV